MKETLRNLFRQKFDYSEYRKVVLQNLLHAQELMREPEFLEETNDGDRIYGLGYLRDADGKEIGLYYTNVTKGDVRHKRVGFRKMMKKYTDFGVDAAITVFADKEHWRLSYMCDLKGGVTAAKRFSYIMGDGGMYVTPVNRLSELAGKRIKLEDIHDAFSVEALSDEFFKAYHDHYDIIVAALARQGKTGAIYHDYVKKMMGRIVFLHFLQKKGWLNGNPTFLRDLFFFSPHKDDFLDQVLEPLFFGIFNTEKEQREKLFASEHWDKNLLKEWESMPYLNGGLFERDEIDKMAIKLPASLFDNLFSFLASYNFTVDENDPDDAEIGVDPEMLGKIFESLLEDNKAKGAFYTPKEIVCYMCKESLIAHLASKLPDVSENVIRTFVETHEMQPELEPYRDTLGNALRDVKICDPAIGSGAFPMGLLNELWRCREALGTGLSRLQLKKEIIENNIYGVDIERGAIDIARLRFWLSIVVDSDKAEPLPNFDYKFMQGNSLIESYGGFDLSRIAGKTVGRPSTSTQLVIGLDSDLSRKNLQKLLRDYFSVTDHLKKATMRHAINDEVKTLIRESVGGTPTFLAKLEQLDPSANQDFFLWHTWFKDIFDNGGFDIVIGNPPYGAKMDEHIKQYIKDNYFSASSHKKDGLKGSTDTFVAFIELGHRILCNQGSLAFIVPMSVGSSDALTSLQYMIEKTCSEIKISSYSNRPKQIFDAACVRTSIFMIKKDMTSIRHIYTTKLNRRTENLTIKDIVDNLAYVDSKGQKIYGRYAKVGTKSEVAILAKLLSSGKRIVDYYDEDGNDVYYRAAGGRYFNVVTNYPTFSSAEKSFKCRYTNIIGLILSSSYFYFYQQVYTDGLNIKRSEIENYPLPLLESIPKEQMFFLENLYQRYLADIEKNASVRQTSSSSTHHVESFKEYKIVRSKAIIDEIDDYVGPLYGLTQEEIDFIKSYELEFRMAGE